MKKMKAFMPVIIVFAILILSGAIHAASWSASSGVKFVDAVIVAKPAGLCGVTIGTLNLSGATVTLYDNKTAASGASLFQMNILAGVSRVATRSFVPPLQFNNGIYADFAKDPGAAGNAAWYSVEYIQQP